MYVCILRICEKCNPTNHIDLASQPVAAATDLWPVSASPTAATAAAAAAVSASSASSGINTPLHSTAAIPLLRSGLLGATPMYEVESILARQLNPDTQRLEYLIHWKGYA